METIISKRFIYAILIFVITCVFSLSCKKFEFSPYNTHVTDDVKEFTEKNIDKIKELQLTNCYSFAVISDIHNFYDELNDFINHINGKAEIAFVLITGDITQNGSIGDYNHLLACLTKLNKPVLTVIGNHDYFLNGDIIYRQMFGNNNYSFLINKVKYVFFDSNFGARPDNLRIDWLENEIHDTLNAEKFILFSHIAPYSFINEADSLVKKEFIQLLSEPHLFYSFFGHEHKWNNIASAKLAYIDCMSHRNYAIVNINNNTIIVNQLSY